MIKGFFEVFNVTINLVFKFENISLKKKKLHNDIDCKNST